MVQTEEIRQKIQVLMNFFNAKRYDEVINKVKPLLRKNPNEVIFHNLLALSLQGSGKTHEGIEILNNALNKFPNNIFILNNLGLLNTSDSNYEKAEKYFKKILDAIFIQNTWLYFTSIWRILFELGWFYNQIIRGGYCLANFIVEICFLYDCINVLFNCNLQKKYN